MRLSLCASLLLIICSVVALNETQPAVYEVPVASDVELPMVERLEDLLHWSIGTFNYF